MVFVSYCPKACPKPLFEPTIRISIEFWIPVSNLSLIREEINKLRKNLIFDRKSDLKLEMKSYSDNAYDVTNFLLFWQVLAYTLFLRSFIVVRPQMAKLNWGLFAPPHPFQRYPGPPSKIGLIAVLVFLVDSLTLFELGFCRPKKKVQLIFIKLMLFSMELFVVSFRIKKLKTGHSLLP